MDREYTYAELLRMKKKRVLRIAGYRNIKHALKDGINKSGHFNENGKLEYENTENLSKKFIARLIAFDK